MGAYSPAGAEITFGKQSNTPSGKPHRTPDSKATGARLVARAMAGAEREPAGVKFRIEDGNHAKTIR